jgi:type I restriction enzyme M protein
MEEAYIIKNAIIYEGNKKMLSEADVRLEIDEALKNKGWRLTGSDKNVFTEKYSMVGRADYVLKSNNRQNPLIIIEAKRKGKDLKQALIQSQRYAQELKAKIAYASDGSIIKTIHLDNLKPLILNGEEIDEFVSESMALQYLKSNEYNTISKQVIKSRKELISVFVSANKELRKEGLQAGIERFNEFCNILFLKIFSEEEEIKQQEGIKLRIPKEFTWDYFKNKDGNELLSYINDTVLKHFQTEYGSDIFAPLQIKNPIILKRIIDKLDPLFLLDTNSDIKGDAFEYFLKAYLASQKKDLGEYFTPRHIVKTLVKLINPKFGETIYDPFCGTGGMLIESFKHIYNKMPRNKTSLEQLKTKTIYGNEITRNAKIVKMNMILTGDGHNNIKRQNSLKNPSKIKHDVVITNMPFSLGVFDEYSGYYKLGNSNSNSLCIEHCFDAIDSSSNNPRIGVIIPEGILFDKKFKKLREYIYLNSKVKNIISLPQGAFKPYTEVKTSILYLTEIKQKKQKQKSIWHFVVKNDGYTLNTKRQQKEGENDLDIFLSFNDVENEDSLLHVGFNKLIMKEVKENDYISIPNPYRKFKLDSEFENIQLKYLIEEMKTRNNQGINVWSVTNDKGFISSKKYFNEQVFSQNTERYKLISPYAFAYNPARINVGSIAFNNSIEIGCVSPMYVVFSVLQEKLYPHYLYWLLQSKLFKKQIESFAFGSVRQTVKFEDFCEIEIPLPSLEQQQEIVKELDSFQEIINHAKKIIKIYKPNFKINIEWDNVKLGNETNLITKGTTPITNGFTFKKEGVNFLKIESITESGEFFKDKFTYISQECNDFLKRSKIKEGDILFSIAGTLGKVAIVTDDILPANTNQALSIIRLNSNSKIKKKYLFYVLKSKLIQDSLEELKVGIAQYNLSLKQISEFKIPLPSLEKQKEIVIELEKERKMIDQQKEIIDLFQKKIDDKIR